MKQRVLAHKKALVVRTEWEIADFSEEDKLTEAKSFHNAAMLRLIKKLKADGHDGLMIGASGCTLCKPCKKALGETCAHPDMMYSCMSAYCIWAKRLAEDCNMNYDYKNNILPFFGMYVFD
jgi:predicted metal-binding protein